YIAPSEVNGGSPGSLRERNRVRIVDALRRQGTASRSGLARLTGLSRTTVGSLVADLQARGLVVEDGPNGNHEQPGRGRPPVLLRLDPAAGVAVGIDFDHDAVRVALADLSSTALAENRSEIDVDHSAPDAAGGGLADIVYVRLGSGIGAGLVLGGRLHRGVAGLAGELGHVQVRTNGAVCRCGNRGCLETIAAEGALKALLRPPHGDDL